MATEPATAVAGRLALIVVPSKYITLRCRFFDDGSEFVVVVLAVGKLSTRCGIYYIDGRLFLMSAINIITTGIH